MVVVVVVVVVGGGGVRKKKIPNFGKLDEHLLPITKKNSSKEEVHTRDENSSWALSILTLSILTLSMLTLSMLTVSIL